MVILVKYGLNLIFCLAYIYTKTIFKQPLSIHLLTHWWLEGMRMWSKMNHRFRYFKVVLSRSTKVLAIPQSCSKKYHHLFVWCLKLKINNFKIANFVFSKKQADIKLKANCTRLWRFILMMTYNMLTQRYYFC